MASMTSKEPEIFPREMELDEGVAETVEAHAKSVDSPPKPEDVPATNGDTKEPAQPSEDAPKSTQSLEVLSSNTELADSALPTPAPDANPTVDTEMAEVNGTSEDGKEKSSDDSVAPTTSTAPPTTEDKHEEEKEKESKPLVEAAPPEPETKPEEPSADVPTTDTVAEDTMDIDVSTERPDLESSAERVEGTQNTSDVSNAPIVSSPNESTQPADLSKLDIQGTQDADMISPTQAKISVAESAPSPAKMAREREDDDAEEPAAKRAKTEDGGETVVDSLVVATKPSSPDTPGLAPQATSEGLQSAIPDSLPITQWQSKRTREVLGNVKKTKNGSNFRKSVEELWPTLWNDYRAKIDNPIDISLIEAKLREDKYANYGEFKADVNQLYENAVLFNGPLHDVSLAAASVRDYILVRMPEIIQAQPPAKPEKGKAHPTRYTEPRAATQPRRQSQSQAQAPVMSPKPKPDSPAMPTPASATAQAFAIPPSGIPQIRRDSTRDDGDRPKRPIQPPKNRDPEYASKASRKKKLGPEQRFLDMVLEEIKKAKYYHINQWFLSPVDPVALNIPNYFKIIKKPMDLTTMSEKNYDGEYKSSKDLEKDMRLIVHNSELFNGLDHEVSNQARQLEELLKTQLSGKDRWMERNYPSAAPSAMHASAASPERSIAESDDDSEGEGEEEDSEAIQNLQQRLNEEQEKLNRLLNSKKPDLTMMEVQQSMVTMLQRKLVEERTKLLDKKTKSSKKKTHNVKSKAKSGGGNLGSANKRSSGGSGLFKKAPMNNKKPPPPKRRPIGPLEKAVIAEGINELDGNTLTRAVEIIKKDTGQNENDEGEMELDIDSLTGDALAKLYDLINKAHPTIRQNLARKPEYSSAISSEPEAKARPGGLPPPKSKKNKPMSKHEQLAKIEQLRELKAQLQPRNGSGSQEPMPGEVGEPLVEESTEESDSEEE